MNATPSITSFGRASLAPLISGSAAVKAPVTKVGAEVNGDSFDALPVAATPATGLTSMSSAVVQDLVKNTVKNAFCGAASSGAKPCSAPMNPERFQNIDATPQFMMGTNYRAYNINGELMVKISPVTQQGGQCSWYDLGKMPSANVASQSAIPQRDCWAN